MYLGINSLFHVSFPKLFSPSDLRKKKNSLLSHKPFKSPCKNDTTTLSTALRMLQTGKWLRWRLQGWKAHRAIAIKVYPLNAVAIRRACIFWNAAALQTWSSIFWRKTEHNSYIILTAQVHLEKFCVPERVLQLLPDFITNDTFSPAYWKCKPVPNSNLCTRNHLCSHQQLY